jgi:hypothetical protein
MRIVLKLATTYHYGAARSRVPLWSRHWTYAIYIEQRLHFDYGIVTQGTGPVAHKVPGPVNNAVELPHRKGNNKT